MKVVHWSLLNNSGLDNVAKEISAAERELGLDSQVLSSVLKEDWDKGMGADIHVSHSHVPDPVRHAGGKLVWVGHGTPEHTFQTAVEQGLNGGYGHADSWMLIQWWLQNADARVTFWPRHQRIWEQLCDKNTKVHCLPFGVNKEFWKPVESKGKFLGGPSVLTAENCHYIKWPLDLAIAWPWVTKEIFEAQLHWLYLPRDQHRWWFPLLNRNGCSFKSYVTGNKFEHGDLRNAFVSVDYVTNFVRYGDYNSLGLQAKACGAKVISFWGNPYADYWLPEGSQELMAKGLIKIFNGTAEANKVEEVSSIKDTATKMIEVYETC